MTLQQRVVRKIRIIIQTLRRKLFSWLPIPRYLPWGVWWLAWGDIVSIQISSKKKFEEGEQKFVLHFLQSGMNTLDLGAHNGFYTLMMSKKIGSTGTVIAFEPSPRERKRLTWNITINRCANIKIEPYALSSSHGIGDLFVVLGGETGCNSLRKPSVAERTRPTQVSLITLDSYLANTRLTAIDFVKIDVEGAELDLMKGATQLLNHFRPVIMCEVQDIRTAPWDYAGVEIYKFLISHGYEMFSVLPSGQLQSCLPKEHFDENLIAVPQEKLHWIQSFVSKSIITKQGAKG